MSLTCIGIFFSEFMNPGGRRWLSVTEIPHTSSRNSALEYSSVSFPYQMLLHWWPHLEDSSAEHQVFFTRGFFDGSAESSQQMLQHDIYGPPKEIPPVVPTLLTHNWPLRYHWVIVLLIAYSYNQPQKKRTTIIFNIIFWGFLSGAKLLMHSWLLIGKLAGNTKSPKCNLFNGREKPNIISGKFLITWSGIETLCW